MALALLATGMAAGLILVSLLASALIFPAFRFWPTPRRWGWQGIVFWSLFRALNLAALLLAAADWQPWHGLSAERIAGRQSPSRAQACTWPPAMPWGAATFIAAGKG